WLLVGLPGYAYLYGIEALWIAAGLWLGTFLNWKFVAARLRTLTLSRGNAITLPQYFANSVGEPARLLRLISAAFILIFFLIYTASGFAAGAKLFSTVLNVSYSAGLLVGAAVIISYTFLGGFLAVSWTDVVQGTIMFFAIIIAPLLVLVKLGGSETAARYSAMDSSWKSWIGAAHSGHSGIRLLSLLGWGLGYFGQPHILARFMAIRSPQQVPIARRIAMFWVSLSLTGAVCMGLIARLYLSPELTGQEAEKAFMIVVRTLAHPFLAGCLLSAVLAAIMSTADSQLLVASSAFVEDIYHTLRRKSPSTKDLMRISRAAVLIIALAALAIAVNPESGVFDLVSYAWAGFGAAFGPLVLFSLYRRDVSANGALAGVVVGGSTVLIWKQLSGGFFDLYEIVPAFLLSSLAIYSVSRWEKR
ncbi:MAG: sodium/proline symporter, partial [candidate division KSB1 bacterium]|nr:sodium/proline symporter [candidate division KSB1 bacterium]